MIESMILLIMKRMMNVLVRFSIFSVNLDHVYTIQLIVNEPFFFFFFFFFFENIRFLVESQCEYWRLILKLSSISSDSVRDTLTKIIPSIVNDQHLQGVFGANSYLTQNVLFRYFTLDALKHPSTDLFVDLIVKLFVDLLNDIHSTNDDQQDEELSFDRRLWPSSEGYNNVFVSENESCDHYCARYGQQLLETLEKILDKSPNQRNNLTKTIEIIRDQCNRLIEIQEEAYELFYIRQRTTIRLNLIIEFLRITQSLEGINLDKLPQLWKRDNQQTNHSVDFISK